MFLSFFIEGVFYVLRRIKRHVVPILCIIALLAPIIGMLLIDFYYYSTVFGWTIGFCCLVASYIIVSKRPDEDDAVTSTTESH